MFDLAAFAPDHWSKVTEREPNGAVRLDQDFLSEDFCVLEGEHFFVRAVLEIPVEGAREKFGFGCWSTLSRANFETYLAGFDDGNFPDWGPWFGWLGNRLAQYGGDEPIAVDVYPQPNRKRPRLRVHDVQQPLGIAQDRGISASQLIEIYRFYGHGPPR